MSRTLIALIALIVVLLVLVDSSLFTVDQNEQVLITQFGQPVRVIRDPGLHTKTPFVQTVLSLRQAAAQHRVARRSDHPR